jgi:hypothetical protein
MQKTTVGHYAILSLSKDAGVAWFDKLTMAYVT